MAYGHEPISGNIRLRNFIGQISKNWGQLLQDIDWSNDKLDRTIYCRARLEVFNINRQRKSTENHALNSCYVYLHAREHKPLLMSDYFPSIVKYVCTDGGVNFMIIFPLLFYLSFSLFFCLFSFSSSGAETGIASRRAPSLSLAQRRWRTKQEKETNEEGIQLRLWLGRERLINPLVGDGIFMGREFRTRSLYKVVERFRWMIGQVLFSIILQVGLSFDWIQQL